MPAMQEPHVPYASALNLAALQASTQTGSLDLRIASLHHHLGIWLDRLIACRCREKLGMLVMQNKSDPQMRAAHGCL